MKKAVIFSLLGAILICQNSFADTPFVTQTSRAILQNTTNDGFDISYIICDGSLFGSRNKCSLPLFTHLSAQSSNYQNPIFATSNLLNEYEFVQILSVTDLKTHVIEKFNNNCYIYWNTYNGSSPIGIITFSLLLDNPKIIVCTMRAGS